MRWVLTRTLQHLMIPHCMTILSHAPLGATPGNYRQAHMFSMPEADDIPPSSRNQGLKPSEDFAEMILQCCEGGSASRFGPRSQPPARTCGRYETVMPTHMNAVSAFAAASWCYVSSSAQDALLARMDIRARRRTWWQEATRNATDTCPLWACRRP